MRNLALQLLKIMAKHADSTGLVERDALYLGKLNAESEEIEDAFRELENEGFIRVERRYYLGLAAGLCSE